MRRAVLVGFLLAVAVGCAKKAEEESSSGGAPSAGRQPSQEPTPAATPPAEKAELADVIAAFRTDPDAPKKYTGRELVAEGTLIDAAWKPDRSAGLHAGLHVGKFDAVVSASFKPDREAEVLALPQGPKVRIAGTISGGKGPDPSPNAKIVLIEMENCRVVSP
jgi:hypothetical protein